MSSFTDWDVWINNIPNARIMVGKETYDILKRGRCSACAQEEFRLHGKGCGLEACPACGKRKAIGCKCIWSFIEPKSQARDSWAKGEAS
jgi:hypothetical protein